MYRNLTRAAWSPLTSGDDQATESSLVCFVIDRADICCRSAPVLVGRWQRLGREQGPGGEEEQVKDKTKEGRGSVLSSVMTQNRVTLQDRRKGSFGKAVFLSET